MFEEMDIYVPFIAKVKVKRDIAKEKRKKLTQPLRADDSNSSHLKSLQLSQLTLCGKTHLEIQQLITQAMSTPCVLLLFLFCLSATLFITGNSVIFFFLLFWVFVTYPQCTEVLFNFSFIVHCCLCGCRWGTTDSSKQLQGQCMARNTWRCRPYHSKRWRIPSRQRRGSCL